MATSDRRLVWHHEGAVLNADGFAILWWVRVSRFGKSNSSCTTIVLAGSVRVFAQHDKRAEHLIVRIMCISPTRVREQKHRRAGQPSPGRPKIEQR